eukprot:6179972-Pleurochrysis_carterae.AAC.4
MRLASGAAAGALLADASATAEMQRSAPRPTSVSDARKQSARPCASRALSAASVPFCSSSFDSAVTSAARVSLLRWLALDDGLSPRALRLGQSLCQWAPLHHRQGAHFSLHFSFGSGRGRFGSVGLFRVASLLTAKACAALGFASSSRLTLRASASLRTLRAALSVRAKSPTPALRESFTSSSVDRLVTQPTDGICDLLREYRVRQLRRRG